MIPDSFQKIINKVARIDINAAQYIKEKYLDRSSSIYREAGDVHDTIAALFLWCRQPQGYVYWRDINRKYNKLPNTTKLGNEL